MRTILCLAVCLALSFASFAHAEGVQIVVFDLEKVQRESDVMKAAQEAVQKQFGAEKETLEKEKAGLEKKAQDFQKKAPTEKEQKAFLEQNQKYNEKAQAYLKLLQAAETRISTDVNIVIETAAKQLAERNGYLLVLDNITVSYFDPKLDVTNDMLTEANAVWKSMFGKEEGK